MRKALKALLPQSYLDALQEQDQIRMPKPEKQHKKKKKHKQKKETHKRIATYLQDLHHTEVPACAVS